MSSRLRRRERRARQRKMARRSERMGRVTTLLLALTVLWPMTLTGCSTPRMALAPIPLPVNMVERATREEMEAWRRDEDWKGAFIAIIERDDCIASMKRDGHWETE